VFSKETWNLKCTSIVIAEVESLGNPMNEILTKIEKDLNIARGKSKKGMSKAHPIKCPYFLFYFFIPQLNQSARK
jgi:hypothetical protein